MIYVLMLLLALTGTAEDVTVPTEGVITDECSLRDPDCPPPPSELPGPRPV